MRVRTLKFIAVFVSVATSSASAAPLATKTSTRAAEHAAICRSKSAAEGPLRGFAGKVSLRGRVAALQCIAETPGDPSFAWSINLTDRTADPCFAYVDDAPLVSFDFESTVGDLLGRHRLMTVSLYPKGNPTPDYEHRLSGATVVLELGRARLRACWPDRDKSYVVGEVPIVFCDPCRSVPGWTERGPGGVKPETFESK